MSENETEARGEKQNSGEAKTSTAAAPPPKKASRRNKVALIGAGVSIIAIAASVVAMSGKPKLDLGAGSQSSIKGATPNARNESMKEVGATESDKRALVNREKADEAAQKGKGFVAQPVIVSSKPAAIEDLPETAKKNEEFKPDYEGMVKNAVREALRDREASSSGVQPILVPTADPVMVQRVNAQIEALLTPEKGGFVSRSFAKGERPQPAQAGTGAARALPARETMIARAGDVAMAKLDRGFNSDDPAAPIFATIVDTDDFNRPGPLHHVRLMGRVIVANDQASIQFDQVVWQNGQISPMKAIAIAQTDARTGIATDVDRHLFMRYGGLLLSSLATGAGQVGQILVQNNRTVAMQPTGAYIATGNHTNWGQVALGAMMPVGQTFTSVFLRNMNQPTTVAAPQGLIIGVVFLQPVVSPTTNTAQR